MKALPERVTFATAGDALPAIVAALHAGEREFELGTCHEFDSSLIGVCLELRRHAAAAGTECRFRDPPPNLRKLATLYGVEPLLFGAANASSAT